jgi:hypothetical protein
MALYNTLMEILHLLLNLVEVDLRYMQKTWYEYNGKIPVIIGKTLIFFL